MRKNNFKQGKKDKVIMLVASLAVIGACTYSGLYVNEKQVKPQKQIVNEISSKAPVEKSTKETVSKQNKQKGTQKKPAKPVSGTSVINELDVAENAIEAVDLPEQTNSEIIDSVSEKQKSPIPQKKEYHFDETSKLLRPVSGEVLLDYSMDKTIYFPTLDQYKYHKGICFKGKENQEVHAAYDGVVKEINNNEELGAYIVFELGDGYEMIYGEIQQCSVGVGDCVKKGDAFAKIAKPTKYYSLEGANLYFAITKDEVSLNPNLYFE